jgi:DNA repair exonuclease SbcCD ATPase subunit
VEERLAAALDASEPDWAVALASRLDQSRAELAALAAAVASLTQAQAEGDRLRQGMAERLQRAIGVDDRLAALEAGAEDRRPLAAIEARLDQLAADRLEDERRARAEADRWTQGHAELGRRLGDLARQLAAVAAETPRLVELEGRVDQLAAERSEDEHRARDETDRLVQAHAEIGRRLDDVACRVAAVAADQPAAVQALADRLQRMEASVEAEVGRMRSEAAALGRVVEELGRLESQVNERLDRRAERAARAADADRQRVVALQTSVEDAITRVTNSLQGQRVALEASLGDGQAAIRREVAGVGAGVDRRLADLQRRAQGTETGLAELTELQASLDGGLGTLRAEIAEVRLVASELAEAQRAVDARLERVGEVQPAPAADLGRGRWRGGKAAAEAEARVDAVWATVQDLARQHQELRNSLDELEDATARTADVAARASSQGAAFAPLRTDVRALREQVAAQAEVLSDLAESVARLAKAAPARKAPASKRASRTSKA